MFTRRKIQFISTVWFAIGLTTGFLAQGGQSAQAQQIGSLPQNTISFFNLTACPTGWGSVDSAAGRLVVPTIPGGGSGAFWGDPLSDTEDRTHTHAYQSQVTLADQALAALGGPNHSTAKDGDHKFSGTTEPASTGLPYVQLLLCLKTVAPDPSPQPIPKGMLTFAGALNCPPGWTQPLQNQGRLMVGLPDGGAPGRVFGSGKPILPQQDPAHVNGLSGGIAFPGHQLAIVSGCCRHGFAQKGQYGYAGATNAAGSNYPFVSFKQCEKD